MDKVCRRCLVLRKHYAVTNLLASLVLPSTYPVRNYATKERQTERKYKDGKLVVEEVEDPTVYPNVLMTFSGTDETVVESYLQFVKKAAKMVDVHLTKSFNMPAKEEKYKAKHEGEVLQKEVEYILKQYQRIVEITDLHGDKADLFIEYIQKSLPAGVQINMELKRWEMLVDPNHLSLRETNK